MDKTAEILFEYLKNLLYYPKKAELNPETLPKEFQKLAQGLMLLNEYVQEERAFSKALAKGDISVTPPSVDNILAMSVKDLQGSLKHLAWQTRQVAKGDYSQRIEFMGEFSDAFNSMTQQLSDRKERLIREKKLVEQKNQDLESMLELTLSLANYTHNMIVVLSEELGELIFINQSAEWFQKMYPERTTQIFEHLLEHTKSRKGESENWNMYIEASSEMEKLFFEVESFSIQWREQQAIVHIMVDATEKKKREELYYNLAYVDPLTRLNNRRYAMELMERWIKEETEFLLTFIDIDYLKICNDTFGHEMGDKYLIDTVNALKTLSGELCRVGGDEFFFLIEGNDWKAREEQLSHVRDVLLNQTDVPYQQSFSYATTVVPVRPDKPLEYYVKITDAKMYTYKEKHKKRRIDVL